MSLIADHLEQISASCQGIDGLPFPPPGIFTNALLSRPDITSLIRDTEAHERALFSVPPPPPPATSADPDPPKPSARRQTVFSVSAGEVTTGPPAGVLSARGRSLGGPARRSTAVAAVLGGHLHTQIVRRGPAATPARHQGQGEPAAAGPGGDVHVDVLLCGAEKLCTVYALPGAPERIASLRQKHAQQGNTLAYYEAKVAEQRETLGRINTERWRGAAEHGGDDGDNDEDDESAPTAESGQAAGRADGGGEAMTEEDLRREEEEVRVLDKKKKELQQRLRALEKDLGGLLNM